MIWPWLQVQNCTELALKHEQGWQAYGTFMLGLLREASCIVCINIPFTLEHTLPRFCSHVRLLLTERRNLSTLVFTRRFHLFRSFPHFFLPESRLNFKSVYLDLEVIQEVMHNAEIFNKCKLCHNGTLPISNVENFFFCNFRGKISGAITFLEYLLTAGLLTFYFRGLYPKLNK